jgi:hypothetical protein
VVVFSHLVGGRFERLIALLKEVYMAEVAELDAYGSGNSKNNL